MSDIHLLKVSDKKWKEAKLFFEENHLAKKYQSKNKKLYFEIDEENNILACTKDFFGEFTVDFINVYSAENGHNFVQVSQENEEANLAFKEVMKNENIALLRFEHEGKEFFQLGFPPNFDWISGIDRVKKSFSKTYQEILNMKLLHKTIFSGEYGLEMRHKIYRGVLATCHPINILKIMQDLIQAFSTPQNVQHITSELERFLTKIILIDRHKNEMQMLREYLKNPNANNVSKEILNSKQVQLYNQIMKLLLVQCQDNIKPLEILQEQLSLVAQQANSYNSKRQELIKKIDIVDMEATSTLDKIIKLELAENLELSTLCAHADQLAFALKNRSCQNYLNILPEDFYGLAWSKNLNDPHSSGQTLKKMVADFNSVSNQVTNDVVHSLGYHHQVNIVIFYVQACKKLTELGDFNNAYAIFAGLNHVAVDRLMYLKNHHIIKSVFQEIDSLYSLLNSMKHYREAVKEALRKGKIVVPFMGLHLKELTFAEDGNPAILTDGTLNLARVELLGEMYGHLDDSLAQLYRATPLKSCLSLKKLDNIALDEETVYDISLHCYPRETPDVSKCKTLEELSGKILIKRSLPLYLCIVSHHDTYHVPKVYNKIIDFIEDRIFKKDICSNDLQIALQLINKIRLHANRNHMLTEEMLKRIDKINSLCVSKIQSIELVCEVSGDLPSGTEAPKRYKHSK